MNLDELMQSIAGEYQHPYTEIYKIGFDKGVERVAAAILIVLGHDALEKVTAHIKNNPNESTADAR